MTDNSTLLNGIGSWAGLGAATGALGMGAANLMQPNDEQHHHKSLLKSMLLGGALGGVVGGGSRALADVYSPQMANDPTSAFSQLLGPKQPQSAAPSSSTAFDKAVGAHPLIAGTTIGSGTTAIAKYLQKLRLHRIANLKGESVDKVVEPTMRGLKYYGTRPGVQGLGAMGLTSLYGYGIRPRLIQEQLVNQATEQNSPLEQAAKQSVH